MLSLSLIVGLAVATCLSWIVFIVSYLIQGRISANNLVVLMGLFLPLVIMGISFCFAYLLMEMKKTQKILKQLLKNNTTCSAVQHTVKQNQSDKDKTHPQTIVSISMDDPISKYEDVNLPENASLRFEK